MIVRLGSRTTGEDVVDLLAACHERIRKFSAMACAVAKGQGPDMRDVREAAGAVKRYFAEAFPLHVADEEELIEPVVALPAKIHDDHLAHAPAIDRLVAMCASVEAGGPVPGDLAPLAETLRKELDEHLSIEERDVFPAIRALPDDMRARLREGIRARRQ
jgi:iron-sulfur cluster repair protein YtfE (RIC family)